METVKIAGSNRNSSWLPIAGVLVAAALFYWLSRYNYLVFHTFIEVFSAVVAGCVFLLTMTLANSSVPAFFVIIGCGQGFVAVFTLLHMMAYKGLTVIGDVGGTLAPQLWIATRLIDAGALVAGVLMIGKTVGVSLVLGTFAAVSALFLASLFVWPVFPVCFIEGVGLTPFKVTTEYVMIAVLAWALWRLHSHRDFFSAAVLRRLEGVYVFNIFTGLFFTLYTDLYGLTNVLGHLTVFVSFLLLADALVRHMVREPQAIWFQDLNASEAKFRSLSAKLLQEKIFTEALLDSVPGILYVYDDQGRLIRWNKQHEEFTGYTADELSRMTSPDWHPPEDQEKVAIAVQEVLTTGFGQVEAHLLLKNGSKRLMQLNGVRLVLDGKTYFTGVGIDITDRKMAEDALRASEVRYRTFMDQSYEALALVDMETRELVEINRRFTELFGFSLPEDAPLYNNQCVVDTQQGFDKYYNETLKHQQFLPNELRMYRHKNGLEIPVERGATVITLDGKDYLLVSVRDMTAERIRQADLNRDVELARRVQRELLPVLQPSPFATIRTIYHPSNVVSGDSYHMEWHNGGKLLRGFLVDVSGHGMGTALQTASVNVLLRELTIAKLPLIKQMQWANARAAKYFTEGVYAAMLAFELDFVSMELHTVGAGITQFQANGRKIETPGMFFGMWSHPDFTVSTLPIRAGDTFHFLTDGFTDALAQPERGGFWSTDGKDFDADVAALERLAKSGGLRDDATGVCVRVQSFPG